MLLTRAFFLLYYRLQITLRIMQKKSFTLFIANVFACCRIHFFMPSGRKDFFMNNYLVGCVKSVGDFTNKETGEVVNYDNVILNFLTDEGVEGGFRGFELKVKSSDLQKITNYSYSDIVTMVKNVVGSRYYSLYPTDITYVMDRSGKAKLSSIKISSAKS